MAATVPNATVSNASKASHKDLEKITQRKIEEKEILGDKEIEEKEI